jgi:7-cyano-7-deazaguanine synthase
MERTALLFSGGMDSTALAFMLKPTCCFTINYGQKPALGEIRAAKQICKVLKLNHIIISIDCSKLGSGDLLGKESNSIAPSSEWWPYRNQLLITFSAMKAIELNINKLIIGSVKNDSFHIDGKKEFIDKMNDVLMIQEGNLSLEAPAIDYTSTELIHNSKISLDILGWSHSCHKFNYACGECRGCSKHRTTMLELGHGIY